MCFVAVEFVDDENVAGMTYWYLSSYDDAAVGDEVIAPLGRHNNLQKGVIRRVFFGDVYQAPFPLYLIKSIVKLLKK